MSEPGMIHYTFYVMSLLNALKFYDLFLIYVISYVIKVVVKMVK